MIAKQQQRQQQTQPMGETVNKPVIKGSCGSSRIWNQINSCVASVVGEKKKKRKFDGAYSHGTQKLPSE